MRILALLVFSLSAIAHAEFTVPALTGAVVDQAQILSPQAEEAIGTVTRQLWEKRGTQLQVLTVSSLEGLPIEEASIKVTDKWKLGDAKTDRGILLLIAPNEHQMRIEVGQGLEGELPDVTAQRIIREEITPHFKAGDYDSGVMAGVGAILRYSDPDFKAQPRQQVHRRKSGIGSLLFFLFLLLLMSLGGGRRRRSGLGGFLLGYGLGGGFGGRGGGSWGGGGGGGWSGGGGGFSGGGSSGSW